MQEDLHDPLANQAELALESDGGVLFVRNAEQHGVLRDTLNTRGTARVIQGYSPIHNPG